MGRLYTVVDGLSPEGRRVLGQAAREKWSAAKTAEALATIGEDVAERTLSRHLVNLRGELERRAAAKQQMEDLVGALRENDASAAEMVQALAMQALIDDPDALANVDPIKMQRAGLAAEELRLKRRALDVKERGVAVIEKRLALMEEREKRAVAALGGLEESPMTADERLQAIREIYGIRTPAAA